MAKPKIAYLLPDPTPGEAEAQRLMDQTICDLMNGALSRVTPEQIEELRKPGKRLRVESGYRDAEDGGYVLWARPVVEDIPPMVGFDDDD